MTATTEHEVTTSAWTEVASGPADCLIQLAELVPVRIHIGTGAPAADAAGVHLGGQNNAFQASGLAVGTSVYVKAGVSPIGTAARVTVIVLDAA